MNLSVCVFCGSREGANPEFAKVASDTGRLCASEGWTLVYGGGNVGLMKCLADGAIEGGGDVVGYIPQELFAREVGKREIRKLHVTETMFERKSRMIEDADAFIILPGGYGTLDEFLEVITLKQLGYVKQPIVLLDVAGYWQPCIDLFDTMFRAGFAAPAIRDLLSIVQEVKQITPILNEQFEKVSPNSLGPSI